MFATHYHELTELASTRARDLRELERQRPRARRGPGLPPQAPGGARRRAATASRAPASPACPSRSLARARALLGDLEKRRGPAERDARVAARADRGRAARSSGCSRAPCAAPAEPHPALETLRARRRRPPDAARGAAARGQPEEDGRADVSAASQPAVGSRACSPYLAVAVAACAWGTWGLVIRRTEALGPMSTRPRVDARDGASSRSSPGWRRCAIATTSAPRGARGPGSPGWG